MGPGGSGCSISAIGAHGLAFSNSISVGRVLRKATASGKLVAGKERGEGALHFMDEDINNLILAACRHQVHEGPAE